MDANGDQRCDILSLASVSQSASYWLQNNLMPKAVATADGVTNSYSKAEGQSIVFSGASSQDSYSDRSVLQYEWTLAPGDVQTGVSVTHSYSDDGVYLVSLKVTDRDGFRNWSNMTLIITDVAPNADFTYSPSSPFEGQTVTFNDASTTGPDPIDNWTWTVDGHTYYSQNIAYQFDSDGTYLVLLTVRDDDGDTNQRTKIVVASDTVPTAAFDFAPYTVNEGGSIDFTSESTYVWDPIINWTWNFDDGGVGYGSSIVHNYVHDGTFTVTLTVRDSDGSNSTSHQVKITDIAPLANFLFAPTDAIEGTNVTFNDTSYSYDGLTARLWDFGDGNSSTSRNITHMFAQNGSYSVKLKIWETDGNTSEMTKVVNVSDSSIQADFWFTPLQPVEGTQVTFHDNSSDYDEIVYWHWDFGDGNSSNGKDVTHVYAQNGTYQVKLSIRDQDGTEANITIPITISDTAPTASFTYAPLTICEGQTVWFNDTSVAYDGIASWYWSFGDNSYSTVRNITHIYQQNGTYQVKLSIRDQDGTEANITIPITISDTGPTASFTYAPLTICEGQTVWFNDTSVAYDGIASWYWDFGDGSHSDLRNATHAYGDNGTYLFSLLVTDRDGSTNSTSTSVSILDLGPQVYFSHTDPIEGVLAFFNDTSTTPVDPIVNWSWNFGDGHLAWGAKVTHAFNRTGSFLVALTIKDDDGSTNSTSKWMSVADVNPVAMFTFSPSSPTEKDTVAFTDTSTTFNQLVEWYWDLGDGSHSSLRNPTNAYSRNGTYHVTLWVQEIDGSNSSHSVELVILETNPTIVTVSLQPAKPSFNEDDSFQVYVYAIKAREDIIRYEWDFHYDGTFQVEAGGSTNHTGHVYPQAGSYQVAVRVWDDDAFSQSSSLQLLNVEVVNVQPHAQFSFRNESAQQVQFDASYSSDNVSDEPLLQFSWNFDDGGGFTAYSSQRIVIHSFPIDGMYNVTLRVRDDDGAWTIAYHKITLDRTVPTVTFDSNGGHATLNEAMTIAVNVTDNVGLASVWLHYKIDNGTEVTVQMTPVGTASHFEGQIPGVNHTATITYWVVAFDSSQNIRTTGQYQILVMAPQVAALQDSTWLWLVVLAALIIATLFYLRGVAAAVEEVFIIYEDGRLMAHQTRRLKPGMDDEILSSMLVAIQSFVKDSFKDESATHLARLDFGKKKILVEKGELVILAVVLHGDRVGKVPQRMKQVMQAMDEQYSPVIRNWDGDLEKVRGIKDMASPLLAGTRVKGRKKEMQAPATIECPACGASIAPESKTCPNCSADLESGNVDALEAVAKDISEEGKK
ncbi:MAG: PKD domain-containing protein [Methanomassiliicoccales archaeon]|nr:PKD domain-containing protein [Methanomassiliicoccales archaeon]